MHRQDVAPETRTVAPPSTALHGRRDELERIGHLLRGARRSQSAVLVLRGPAGVGKSALLDEARAHAADMQVLTCRGTESEARLPFAALHQLLRPVLDRGDASPPAGPRPALRARPRVRLRRRAASSSRSPCSACSPRPPSAGRCCAWSTTHTGSTRRRPTRSSSSPGAWTPSRSRCSSPRARSATCASMRPGSRSCDVVRPRRRPRTRSSIAPGGGRSRPTSREWLVERDGRQPARAARVRGGAHRGAGAPASSRSSARCPSASHLERAFLERVRAPAARDASGCCSSPPPTRAAS